MSSNNDSEQYKLAEKRSEKISLEIQQVKLSVSQSVEKPFAVIVGGQPGAGKTTLVNRAKSKFREVGGSITIDADELRTEHPQYQKLLKVDDKKAADLTHPDASKWSRELLAAAVAGKRNIIVDQTSRDPKALENLSNRLKESGYEVGFSVVASDLQTSRQRVFQRYEEQKKELGSGRFVTAEHQKQAFEGLAESVKAAEAKKFVDHIKVHDRHGEKVYVNSLKDGQWSRQPPQAHQVFEHERGRQFSELEKKNLDANWEGIKTMMSARKADPADIQEVSAIQAEDRKKLGIVEQVTAKSMAIEPEKSDRKLTVYIGADAPKVAENLRLSDQKHIKSIDDLSKAGKRPVMSMTEVDSQKTVADLQTARTKGYTVQVLQLDQKTTDQKTYDEIKAIADQYQQAEPARAGRTYNGVVVSQDADRAIQRTATGKLIIHETEKLDGLEQGDAGRNKSISYAKGGDRATVTDNSKSAKASQAAERSQESIKVTKDNSSSFER